MTKPPDFDTLVDALRSDLPSDADRERVRARLLAAGVAVGASVAAPSAAAAAAASLGNGSAVTGGAQTGVTAHVAGMSLASKLGVLAVVVAAGASVPIAANMQARSARSDSGAVVHAHATRARAHSPAAAAAVADVRAIGVQERSSTLASKPAAEISAAPSSGISAAIPIAKRRASAMATTGASVVRGVEAPSAGEGAQMEGEARVLEAESGRDMGAGIGTTTGTTTITTTTTNTTTTTITGASTATATGAGSRLPAGMVEAAPSALNDEADLLARALRALRAGDREGARAALAAHAQRYPHGMLARERERVARRIDGAAQTLKH